METTMEMEKFQSEIAQLNANTAKIQAETMKIQAEIKWYPLGSAAAGAIIAAAIMALAKLL